MHLNAAITEATDRFSEASEEMRRVAHSIQNELQATRSEIKRGVFDLPEETKESTAAMRRLVSDQVRALNDLTDIVNTQRDRQVTSAPQQAATSMPASTLSAPTAAAARPEPVTPKPAPTPEPVAQAPQPAPAPQVAPAPIAQAAPAPVAPAPTPAVTATQPAPTQAPEAPAFAPRAQAPTPQIAPQAAPTPTQEGGWVQDLLRRASTEENAAPAPAAGQTQAFTAGSSFERSPEHIIDSLYSLSVDITRSIDRDGAVELWERYQRGERNVFTRRLRTLESRELSDEIKRLYTSNPDFAASVDRYVADFEVLILEVSKNDPDNRQSETYLNSDTGRVYTIFAQAINRFS